MDGFRKFMKDKGDAEKSLSKLPKAHRDLAAGFEVKFEPNHTLKGDDGHVGEISVNPKKTIRISSPWNYPREFAFLHELAHLVYEKYVRGTNLEEKWEKVCKLHDGRKKDESDEENWCHCYANYFCKRPVVIHDHPAWEKYMKEFIRRTG